MLLYTSWLCKNFKAIGGYRFFCKTIETLFRTIGNSNLLKPICNGTIFNLILAIKNISRAVRDFSVVFLVT